jgi:hypothetical protein
MTPTDNPEEDQELEPESTEIPKASEVMKQKRKIGNREISTFHPGEGDSESTSKIEGKTTPRPTTRSRLQALVSSWPDRPMDSLPASPFRNESEQEPSSPTIDQAIPGNTGGDDNPGRRLHAVEAAAKAALPVKLPWRYRLRPNRELTHRAYWDVAATFSLLVNAVLIGLLLIMAQQIRSLRTTVNILGNDALGGLYGNFVKMDQASINTTIAVNAQIPLDFNLPVSQNTEVALTRDVQIPGAHVVINTGVLNINAQANVTLPAGTSLPLTLNLEIPVHSTIPISLQVPVSIPLNRTDLHEPLTGLQTTLRPLYCAFNKNAQYPEGTFICAEHDTATPGIP